MSRSPWNKGRGDDTTRAPDGSLWPAYNRKQEGGPIDVRTDGSGGPFFVVLRFGLGRDVVLVRVSEAFR